VAEQRWQALRQNSGLPEGNQGVVVLSSRSPLYFDPGFLAEESLRRSQHFSPQTSQPVSREAALATWIEQVGRLAELHPKTRFVLFLPTPEFGSGVPMETCRPQWFRARCCRAIAREWIARGSIALMPTCASNWLACWPAVPMWFFPTQLMLCVQPRAFVRVSEMAICSIAIAIIFRPMEL
jgi:hypothetical protein